MNSYIGRWAAWVIAPAAALIAGLVSNEAQTLAGINLSQSHLVIFLLPIVGTVVLATVKWLENNGAQELSVLERDLHLSPAIVAEIEKLIESHLPPAPTPAPIAPVAAARPRAAKK